VGGTGGALRSVGTMSIDASPPGSSPSTGAATATPSPPSLRSDVVAGFLVFLIALPLCIGISLASGFPPVAGLFTAIIGGLVVSPLMGAPLTIKGPAAGLIVIALGAVTELGEGQAPGVGYRRALAVVAVSGVLQIGLGLLRAGRLADFFPSSVVHGMLAAIGVIICAKQTHTMVGVKPEATEPLELLAEIPHSLAHGNPAIVGIALLALVILFGLPKVKHPLAKKVPAQLVVLLAAIPLGFVLDLDHEHTYSFASHSYELGPKSLVTVPNSLLGAVTFPDFSVLGSATSLRYLVMFTLVGSIESLLSARAIDGLDPRKGKSNYDRDLFAVGVGNTLAGLVGGLPMIAEIVRSKANLDAGARSRWANFAHGAFLLGFVALLPMLIHRIPLAALAAMLVVTGTRLASPGELVHAYHIGREQVVVFVVTMLGCVGVDLLVGVGLGIATKMVIQLALGARLGGLFRVKVEEHASDDQTVLEVRGAATFSNYLGLKARIVKAAARGPVLLDLSRAPLVDHTTQERLRDLEAELAAEGRTLTVRGVNELVALSTHPLAVRRRIPTPA
jgi:MFS superfamily sulfate permease-like transporter